LLLQRGVHHQKVSVIAVLCLRGSERRSYFRLHLNADIHAQQVISFLRYLEQELNGPWLLLWDRLSAHRARRTSQFLAARSCPQAYFLPAYAPDLNPIEYAWCHLKMNPLANSPYFDLPALTQSTRRHARTLQRKPHLLSSFLRHSFFCLHTRTLLIQDSIAASSATLLSSEIPSTSRFHLLRERLSSAVLLLVALYRDSISSCWQRRSP
jgi:transposase